MSPGGVPKRSRPSRRRTIEMSYGVIVRFATPAPAAYTTSPVRRTMRPSAAIAPPWARIRVARVRSVAGSSRISTWRRLFDLGGDGGEQILRTADRRIDRDLVLAWRRDRVVPLERTAEPFRKPLRADPRDVRDGRADAEPRERADLVHEAAGDHAIERREVRVHVQREPVTRHAARDAHPDGRDLRVTPVGQRDPDAGPALDGAGRDAEVGERGSQGVLERPHIRDDVRRVAEREDRVPDQLPGPVVGDVATAVDAIHGRAGAAQILRC